MSLNIIAELSRKYGCDPAYVIAGGGNTSWKDEKYLYVKPSGIALAQMTENDFVKMDREIIRSCFTLPEFADKAAREAKIKSLMAFAVVGSDKRPSVEAPLHEILPYKFIVHTHPELVNGMTCGNDGKKICAELFPQALWIDYCDPGYTLAKVVFEKCTAYEKANGRFPQVLFLQNHGVFVAADSADEIDDLYNRIMTAIAEYCAAKQVSLTLTPAAEADAEAVMEFAPALRGWLRNDDKGKALTVASAAYFKVARGPLTPDHLVYAKAFALIDDAPDAAKVAAFRAAHGYQPRMVEIPGKVVFGSGKNKKAADTVLAMARNGAVIEQIAQAFGGVHYLSDAQREFIENWEVESYRAKVAGGSDGDMTGLVAVVTGGAQGFGYGIAQSLAALGVDVAVADLNVEGACKAAQELGAGARGFAVNVSDEASVEQLAREVVKEYGGIDLLVSNAGVARAGSVKSFAFKDWKFVTDINYNGFFLCSKFFAQVMAKQNAVTGLWTDIVQVNSKSGLVGSKNNGAYAGSKFGGIGLVQSFALELVGDKIKVNAVCPGNFLDGPLWSDPVRGLFVQYLAAGKVPGAKTVEDVRKHYESLVPMGRGCFPADVAKAIVYAVRQQYESGQAIPVTGGQVMLS